MYAGELTESGSLLIDMLAAAEGVSVTTERCDLTASPITDIDLPVGSLIYTSYAAQYVPFVCGAVRPATVASIRGITDGALSGGRDSHRAMLRAL